MSESVLLLIQAMITTHHAFDKSNRSGERGEIRESKGPPNAALAQAKKQRKYQIQTEWNVRREQYCYEKKC